MTVIFHRVKLISILTKSAFQKLCNATMEVTSQVFKSRGSVRYLSHGDLSDLLMVSYWNGGMNTGLKYSSSSRGLNTALKDQYSVNFKFILT